METKLHRLEAAVEYLKNRGLIHRQKDIAIAMNASPATISGALAGSVWQHLPRSVAYQWRLLLSWAERCADYRTFAAKTNKALGEIHTGLTTYWARHSWATIAASLDISEDTIALALGHASAHATTSIYIERSLRKVDEANRRVLDAVK